MFWLPYSKLSFKGISDARNEEASIMSSSIYRKAIDFLAFEEKVTDRRNKSKSSAAASASPINACGWELKCANRAIDFGILQVKVEEISRKSFAHLASLDCKLFYARCRCAIRLDSFKVLIDFCSIKRKC
jgi:hypothetical protein